VSIVVLTVFAFTSTTCWAAANSPAVEWETFFSGSSTATIAGRVATDGRGDLFVTGTSGDTWGNPILRFHALDAFVAKFDSNGSLVWNTFLGSSLVDEGVDVKVDANGNVFVLGVSQMTWGSPVSPFASGGMNAFLAALDKDGNLLWTTFFDGGGEPGALAIDGTDNLYVTGSSIKTWGSPLNHFVALTDAYAAKFAPNGTLLWNTFFGDGHESGTVVSLDSSGSVYVAGNSVGSWGSPIRPYTPAREGLDAFVAKLSPSGGLIWNTFLGGGGQDEASGLSVTAAGDVYVGGLSDSSWGTPLSPIPLSGQVDNFLARLDANGNLIWSTFFGGKSFNQLFGMTADDSGQVYVTGMSIGTWGSPLSPFVSAESAFAAAFSSSGALVWNGFFLGGSVGSQGTGIAVDGGGNVTLLGLAGQAGGTPLQPFTEKFDAFLVRLTQTKCSGTDTVLCLNQGRFKVEAHYDAGSGNSGSAHVVQLTPDTGYLWFFGAENVEAVVKVLDGCGAGGHYWVFAGGLTNVNVVVTVTDTETNDVQTYTNPANTQFQPVQDTAAFATCSASPNARVRVTPKVDTSKSFNQFINVVQSISSANTSSSCAASPTSLCLENGRFTVTAHFDAGSGNSADAQVVPLTADTGYLWFFDSANVEVVAKVVNGCPVNGNYWLFAGGLTDVNVKLTVTDNSTGATKTYTNPANTPFQPIQDTSAFSTCP
jgi:hypothetical protein